MGGVPPPAEMQCPHRFLERTGTLHLDGWSAAPRRNAVSPPFFEMQCPHLFFEVGDGTLEEDIEARWLTRNSQTLSRHCCQLA
ncbi:hypothetical protein Q31a_47600 [Aureliella helgolandensis]|uniref:Uncharacterized protein n=1 Tax=Aureliella helgolandensis TaxID=2527968 RepID=A0A518GCR1_9BACT|nr:hypothetical protein Q31a_47600 [Aureliella helgolandensis]